jgi:hypothetical protein
MISLIHFISAKRRLHESNKTVYMMGDDCPPMLLAQRDMIQHEMEYYKEQVVKLSYYALLFVVGVLLYYFVLRGLI